LEAKLHIGHCASAIEKHWDEGPTFIAITGDIAQRGLPEEYEAALQWLSDLVANFSWSIPSNRIYMVPGNHDICLPLASSSLLALQTKENSEQLNSPKDQKVDWIEDNAEGVDKILNFAFRPYLDFSKKLTLLPWLSEPTDQERQKANRFSYPWLESRFRHLGVVFFGFNSAQPIVPRVLPNREVPEVTIEDIVTEAKKVVQTMDSPPLFIGMTHHYPLAGQKDLAIDNPINLNQLYTDIPKVALWLHGHWHLRETTLHSTKDKRRLVVNSSPSLTVKEKYRPPDSARGFSMIELERHDSRVTGCSIFAVEYENGSLVSRCVQGGEYTNEYTLAKDGYFQQRI